MTNGHGDLLHGWGWPLGVAIVVTAAGFLLGTFLEFCRLAVHAGPDARLGHDLRLLAEMGEAPMLVHGEHGWRVMLRCGRDPLPFRETPEVAAADALLAHQTARR